ncbi:ATP-binding protein [Paenibacillus sp. FSL K6-3182]|uniref:sensor histidine kinase n=1 Tax=unclassified Paenibacillus TaxID=185978 RepID=UPI0030CC646F
MNADDGIGMDEEELGQLLDGKYNEQRGIGLLNTDRRLKQLYGHGLVITSKLNFGTKVSFQIP